MVGDLQLTADEVMALPPGKRVRVLELLRERELYERQNRFRLMFPGDGPLSRDKYPKHLLFFRYGALYRIRCFMAGNRVGKALKHGTRVATPFGWRAIEALKPGDLVIAGDGSPTQVVATYPQGEVDLFDVVFDGHTSITTCGQHLWKYLPPKGRYPTRHSHGKWEPNPAFRCWRVGDTQELAGFNLRRPKQRPVVPAAEAFKLPPVLLLIDPYVLGVLLGDGGLSGGTVKLSTTDPEIVEAVGAHFRVCKYQGCDYGVNGAVGPVKSLGLFGTTSSTKFVPPEYLVSDAADRLALLQGLMDTDGYIGKQGAMEYTTCSDRLADDFEWLAVSLGMKVRRTRRHTKSQDGRGQPSWRIVLRSPKVCPFRLPRKMARWRPLRETGDWLVHAVKPAGRGHATCIEVAHPSHTFVVDHGVVTHNTETSLYEVVAHMTGEYPDWWEGKRFDEPVRCWLVGETAKLVREGIQTKLFGPWGEFGTGMIPAVSLGRWTPKQGVPETVDTFRVKHKPTGLWSTGEMKSYDQGAEQFASVEREVVLLDEEPPEAILDECVMRTMTTRGVVLMPFTPLKGVTRVVSQFYRSGKPIEGPVPDADDPKAPVTRALVLAGWDDAPHLDEVAKAELAQQYKDKPHQLKARRQGIPELGSGLVFPVAESSIVVAPFEIPSHWVRICGIDFGWDHPTGAVELAWDRDNDRIYVVRDLSEREMTPLLFAASVKPWGDWLPWAWPHDGKQSGGKFDAKDQRTLREIYAGHGLAMLTDHAQFPDGGNGVEAGITEMLERMQTGRWKVFATCTNWLSEFRTFHRKDGLIVPLGDDVISASRYAYMMRRYARVKPKGKSTLTISTNWRTA